MTRPSFGKIGGKPEFCVEHAEEEMANVVNERCRRSGCNKRSSYGKGEVGGKPEFCAEHAEEDMVDVRNKRRAQRVQQAPVVRQGGGEICGLRPTCPGRLVDLTGARRSSRRDIAGGGFGFWTA